MIAVLDWPELDKARVKGHYRRTTHGGRAWVREHMRHGEAHVDTHEEAPEGATEEGKRGKKPTFSWTAVGKPGDWGRKRSAKETAWLDTAIGHGQASEAVLEAVRRAHPLAEVREGYDGASYGSTRWSRMSVVHMRRRQGFDNTDDLCSSFRHEYGHHIDFCMSEDMGGTEYGQPYAASGYAAEALEADRRVLAKPVEQSDIDRVHDSYAEDFRTLTRQEGLGPREALSQMLEEEGFRLEDVDFWLGRRQDNEPASVGTVIALLTAVYLRDMRGVFRICDSFCDPMYERPGDRPYLHFADCIGSLTRLQCTPRSGWGHSASYYQRWPATEVRGYTMGHTTETYANWFASEGNPRPFWSTLIARMAPETYTAFANITDAWIHEPMPDPPPEMPEWAVAQHTERSA